MQDINQQKPPLFDLFITLREKAGLPLTIDQYDMLLQALKGGFGIASRDELKQICRLLWVKSKSSSQAEKFEQYFEEYFQQLQLQAPNHKSTRTTKATSPDAAPSQTSANETSSATSLTPNHESSRTTKETSSDAAPSQTSANETSSATSLTPLRPLQSSPQIPIAMRGELLPEKPFREDYYQLSVKDFPVTERQIQQNWRYLRRFIREGAFTEVDIEATVQQISQDGVFLEPVLIQSRMNRAELLLLIDVSHSMVPFHLLSQKLVDNLQSGRLGKADTYYFRNCPRDYLYFHPQSPDAKPIHELLPKLHSNRTIALIISDGGAARGGINRERISLTAEFLQNLIPCVRHIAWLNPIPEERWQGTTAQAISQMVQMFELNPFGLKAAIRSRKG